MRVLTAKGHGFGWVRYSASGSQLLALSRFSDEWWLWDLARDTPGVKLPTGEPYDTLFDILRVRHGEAFLRTQGYWPEEEWPVGDGLRAEHEQLASQLVGSFRKRCFTPDGRGLLQETVGPLYRTPDQLAVWDFSGQIVRRHALADPAWGPGTASYSADGRLLVLVYYRDAEIRESATDTVLTPRLNSEQQITDHALSPDAAWLATSAGRVVRVWDARTGQLAHRFRAFRATTDTLAFSPDGRLLAAGSREGRVRAWEVASGRELSDLALGKKDVEHVAFSPDGQTLAAACKDKCVVVLDIDF